MEEYKNTISGEGLLLDGKGEEPEREAEDEHNQ